MSGKINAINTAAAQTAESKAIMTIVESDATKSSKIRALDVLGVNRSTIANLLTNFYGKEVKYQHVRNVLVTIVNKPVEQPRVMVEGDL
jgi:hypothetical protein